MKQGDIVLCDSVLGEPWKGEIIAGPKPNKKKNYYDVLDNEGFAWTFPENRLSLVVRQGGEQHEDSE